MKTILRAILVLAVAAPGVAAAQDTPPAPTPAPAPAPAATELAVDEATSYAVGFQVGSNFARGGLELDAAALVEGLKAGMAGAEPQYEMEAMQQSLMALQQRAMQVQQARAAAEAEATRQAGAAFLEVNAAREGVTVLPSGLQYEVLQEGTGDSPEGTDQVTVHYRGTLVDGTVFDSSYDRGQPATFPVGGVIPGFGEGLQLMQEGAKYKLYIPSDIAYGDRGAGTIPPGSTLVFEVELLEVVEPEPQPAAGAEAGGEQK